MSNEKNIYWQSVRGICILAVVLIHSLQCYDFNNGIVIIRQIINFAVAIFVFMAGYFVNIDKVSSKRFSAKRWIINRGGERLCVPFIFWSLIYSMLSCFISAYNGNEINWIKLLGKIFLGKASAPFYYIVVLIQLAFLTPWLARIIKKKTIVSRILWFITPGYLVFIYAWNFITKKQPLFYETPFMAWFLFYYLGLQVRNGMKLKCNLGFVIGTWILSCFEAFALKMLGMEVGFYTSQITFGSFLYATAVIGLILKNAENNMLNKPSVIKKIGDCSYGIFYIHMLILSVVKCFIINENWLIMSGIRFVFTALISFAIVYIGQLMLKNHEKALKIVGFI